jgi:serpin B
MWIFLPDEGVSPEQLHINSSLTGAVLCSADGRQCSDSDGKPLYKYDHVQLVLSLPKFDVDAELDLKGMLRNMGIHDVFDPEIADLSGLVSNVQAYVTSASHAARVKIDEEGCEAAAYTVITVDALGWMEQKPLEFKVDRPFAFAITGSDGLPLFTGIVNEP